VSLLVKSKLIIKWFLVVSLLCLTFFNLNLLLHARTALCETQGAPECSDETQDVCDTVCDGLGSTCQTYLFVSGECGCSALCTQLWKYKCYSDGGYRYHECETFWGGCPFK